MASGWHILRDGDALTLARHLPVRWDVSASAPFPRLHKRRLAEQVRQDMWRMLQDLRGFSPVVQVAGSGEDLTVTAGGAVLARVFPKTRVEARLVELLTDPARRARWANHARERDHG